jgi:hypothetical protein
MWTKNQIEVASELAENRPRSDSKAKHVQYIVLVPLFTHEYKQENLGWVVMQMYFAAFIDKKRYFLARMDDEGVPWRGNSIKDQANPQSLP